MLSFFPPFSSPHAASRGLRVVTRFPRGLQASLGSFPLRNRTGASVAAFSRATPPALLPLVVSMPSAPSSAASSPPLPSSALPGCPGIHLSKLSRDGTGVALACELPTWDSAAPSRLAPRLEKLVEFGMGGLEALDLTPSLEEPSCAGIPWYELVVFPEPTEEEHAPAAALTPIAAPLGCSLTVPTCTVSSVVGAFETAWKEWLERDASAWAKHFPSQTRAERLAEAHGMLVPPAWFTSSVCRELGDLAQRCLNGGFSSPEGMEMLEDLVGRILPVGGMDSCEVDVVASSTEAESEGTEDPSDGPAAAFDLEGAMMREAARRAQDADGGFQVQRADRQRRVDRREGIEPDSSVRCNLALLSLWLVTQGPLTANSLLEDPDSSLFELEQGSALLGQGRPPAAMTTEELRRLFTLLNHSERVRSALIGWLRALEEHFVQALLPQLCSHELVPSSAWSDSEANVAVVRVVFPCSFFSRDEVGLVRVDHEVKPGHPFGVVLRLPSAERSGVAPQTILNESTVKYMLRGLLGKAKFNIATLRLKALSTAMLAFVNRAFQQPAGGHGTADPLRLQVFTPSGWRYWDLLSSLLRWQQDAADASAETIALARRLVDSCIAGFCGRWVKNEFLSYVVSRIGVRGVNENERIREGLPAIFLRELLLGSCSGLHPAVFEEGALGPRSHPPLKEVRLLAAALSALPGGESLGARERRELAETLLRELLPRLGACGRDCGAGCPDCRRALLEELCRSDTLVDALGCKPVELERAFGSLFRTWNQGLDLMVRSPLMAEWSRPGVFWRFVGTLHGLDLSPELAGLLLKTSSLEAAYERIAGEARALCDGCSGGAGCEGCAWLDEAIHDRMKRDPAMLRELVPLLSRPIEYFSRIDAHGVKEGSTALSGDGFVELFRQRASQQWSLSEHAQEPDIRSSSTWTVWLGFLDRCSLGLQGWGEARREEALERTRALEPDSFPCPLGRAADWRKRPVEERVATGMLCDAQTCAVLGLPVACRAVAALPSGTLGSKPERRRWTKEVRKCRNTRRALYQGFRALHNKSPELCWDAPDGAPPSTRARLPLPDLGTLDPDTSLDLHARHYAAKLCDWLGDMTVDPDTFDNSLFSEALAHPETLEGSRLHSRIVTGRMLRAYVEAVHPFPELILLATFLHLYEMKGKISRDLHLQQAYATDAGIWKAVARLLDLKTQDRVVDGSLLKAMVDSVGIGDVLTASECAAFAPRLRSFVRPMLDDQHGVSATFPRQWGAPGCHGLEQERASLAGPVLELFVGPWEVPMVHRLVELVTVRPSLRVRLLEGAKRHPRVSKRLTQKTYEPAGHLRVERLEGDHAICVVEDGFVCRGDHALLLRTEVSHPVPRGGDEDAAPTEPGRLEVVQRLQYGRFLVDDLRALEPRTGVEDTQVWSPGQRCRVRVRPIQRGPDGGFRPLLAKSRLRPGDRFSIRSKLASRLRVVCSATVREVLPGELLRCRMSLQQHGTLRIGDRVRFHPGGAEGGAESPPPLGEAIVDRLAPVPGGRDAKVLHCTAVKGAGGAVAGIEFLLTLRPFQRLNPYDPLERPPPLPRPAVGQTLEFARPSRVEAMLSLLVDPIRGGRSCFGDSSTSLRKIKDLGKHLGRVRDEKAH